jgi:hypothetical protein
MPQQNFQHSIIVESKGLLRREVSRREEIRIGYIELLCHSVGEVDHHLVIFGDIIKQSLCQEFTGTVLQEWGCIRCFIVVFKCEFKDFENVKKLRNFFAALRTNACSDINKDLGYFFGARQ